MSRLKKIGMLLTIGLLGCAGQSNGKSSDPVTPLPVKGPPEALTLLPAAETPTDIGVVAHAPEVDVSSVTTAWFQGLESASTCISVHMGQADAPETTDPIVLADGDELSVELAHEKDSLPDGAYNQQITIEGAVPQYEAGGYLVSGKQGVLVVDYHPYEVRSGVFRSISADEYRSRTSSKDDGSPMTAPDLLPKNCMLPTAPATVNVVPANSK